MSTLSSPLLSSTNQEPSAFSLAELSLHPLLAKLPQLTKISIPGADQVIPPSGPASLIVQRGGVVLAGRELLEAASDQDLTTLMGVEVDLAEDDQIAVIFTSLAANRLKDDQLAILAAYWERAEVERSTKERAKRGGKGKVGKRRAKESACLEDGVSSKQTKDQTSTPKVRARDRAAKGFGLRVRSIRIASKLLKLMPGLADRVLAGDLTLLAANKLLPRPQGKQNQKPKPKQPNNEATLADPATGKPLLESMPTIRPAPSTSDAGEPAERAKRELSEAEICPDLLAFPEAVSSRQSSPVKGPSPEVLADRLLAYLGHESVADLVVALKQRLEESNAPERASPPGVLPTIRTDRRFNGGEVNSRTLIDKHLIFLAEMHREATSRTAKEVEKDLTLLHQLRHCASSNHRTGIRCHNAHLCPRCRNHLLSDIDKGLTKQLRGNTGPYLLARVTLPFQGETTAAGRERLFKKITDLTKQATNELQTKAKQFGVNGGMVFKRFAPAIDVAAAEGPLSMLVELGMLAPVDEMHDDLLEPTAVRLSRDDSSRPAEAVVTWQQAASAADLVVQILPDRQGGGAAQCPALLDFANLDGLVSFDGWRAYCRAVDGRHLYRAFGAWRKSRASSEESISLKR
jgi:hypothetical protein